MESFVLYKLGCLLAKVSLPNHVTFISDVTWLGNKMFVNKKKQAQRMAKIARDYTVSHY